MFTVIISFELPIQNKFSLSGFLTFLFIGFCIKFTLEDRQLKLSEQWDQTREPIHQKQM